MSTKLNTIKKKLMLGTTLLVTGMIMAPYASAMPAGGYCSECRRILWTWLCYPC